MDKEILDNYAQMFEGEHAQCQELVEALELIAWSNNTQWQADKARAALTKHKEQAGTCSPSKKDWVDVLTKMNKVIQEAECISPVVKEIASSKVAWLRGDIVVGEYEKNC